LARFAEALGDDASFHWDGERLDFTGVAARLRTPPGPVLLAGTSFAFVHLLDATFQHLPLPTGSRIMQTGGFKGRSREIPANRLRRDLATRFGLPITRVVAEYGMTELGSQLYQPGVIDRTTVSYYRAPHWLRVQAVDPVSLEPVPAGEPGLARFVDLVNVDSAVALLTADRIRMVDPTTIELLGRQPGALPRGCSLTLEHLLQ
ncbi:MAG: acyl-protein synthetase, partial [Myxococcota bacterium]